MKLFSARSDQSGSPLVPRYPRTLAAVSLGNIFFLRLWDAMLYTRDRDYVSELPLRLVDYSASILGVVLLSGAAFAFISLAFNGRGWIVRTAAIACILFLCLPPSLFSIRALANHAGMSILPPHFGLAMAAGIVPISVVLLRQRFLAIVISIVAVFWPYALLNLATLATRAYASVSVERHPTVGHASAPARERSPAHGREQQRIIWVVFDEWDQAAVFDRRPQGLPLPHLDALVRRSVAATNAIAPAGSTMASLPSLLTGRAVVDAKVSGAYTLWLKQPGSDDWTNFGDLKNIISDSAAKGKNVSVIGWYHPYGRLFADTPRVTAFGFGFPFSQYAGYQGSSLLRCLRAQFAAILRPPAAQSISASIYNQIHQRVLMAAADDAQALVFAHYNIPHVPSIVPSGVTDSLPHTLQGSPYFSNLLLVDKTVGELVERLEASHLSDRTTLILTSDHWWRTAPAPIADSRHRVPLIICAARGGGAVSTDELFCTVYLADLVSRILEGTVTTNGGVATWIKHSDHHAVPRYVGNKSDWSVRPEPVLFR